MKKTHQRNSVRYYLLVVALLVAFFFIGDFGTLDTQKTAIVMAVGVDKEGEEFVITSQIAIPSSGEKTPQTMQLVSTGKTISEAVEQINAKTGWYPKLVFCKLILLGEKTAQDNVFDALDFFLLDEYLADDCQLAVCRGLAKDILNTTPLIDPSSSVAIRKILSSHAERVGTVHPVNLKDFSIGYFGDSRSAMLPVVKTELQQEEVTPSTSTLSSKESGSSKSKQEGQGGDEKKNKPVFSAGETALFTRGIWRETLNKEEPGDRNVRPSRPRPALWRSAMSTVPLGAPCAASSLASVLVEPTSSNI